MKKIFVLILFWIILSQSTAFAQFTGGNGGKGFSAVLSKAIIKMLKIMSDQCDQHRNDSTWNQKICGYYSVLDTQLSVTKVESDYIVYGKIDGRPRDAINDGLPNGQKFIVYSEKHLYSSTPEERRLVLLHELATLAGLESSDTYLRSISIIELIGNDPEFKSILAELPPKTVVSRTFHGAEVSASVNGKVYAILLHTPEDYQNFCVSKGYDQFDSFGEKSDVSLKEWEEETQLNNGVVTLNNLGDVVSSDGQSSSKSRVITKVTCR